MEIKECVKTMQSCDALKSKLISLKQIEENEFIVYPTKFIMFGFPCLEIQSKEELRGRICELKDLLCLELEKESD